MKRHKRILQLCINLILVVAIFVSVLMVSTVRGDAAVLAEANAETSTIFLPVVMKNYPWISPFGVETQNYLTEGSLLLQRATELDARWVRLNNKISWVDLQPNEGDPINWGVLATFENQLRALESAGITPIVIVNDFPRWATVYPSSCAALRTDKLNVFAGFVRELVKRYSTAEFNVHNWEFGNEPDIDPTLVPVDHFFGCWGDIDDPFYGGRQYGEMLKVVTPVVKAADPSAKVWVGGLLLDNPNTTNPSMGKPEKFLQGVLEAGAGQYFDILPYHAYFGYNGQLIDQDNGVTTSVWYSWGGYVVGKANFLRQIMAQYGFNKPLFVNEIALNCPEYNLICNPPDNSFWEIQASQLVRSYARGLGDQIIGFTWYTLEGPGWRNGGLLDSSQNPRPVYYAYQVMISMLNNANYLSQINYGNGIEGYRFDTGSTYIDVLWAKENQILTITFPQLGFKEARSRDGGIMNPTSVSGNFQLPVAFAPIYIVFGH